MKIGVLGSGDVGKTLAAGLAASGYEVTIGSDHTDKLKEFSEQNPTIKVSNFAEAAAFGELIVLSVKGNGAEELVKKLSSSLTGKTIVDTTNPIADSPPENGVLSFFTDLNESLMEKLQKAIPKANFVKAFNCVGAAAMVDPDFGGVKPTMFIAGNNEAAKKQVTEILEKFGWEAEDMGGAQATRAIEPLCILWCIPGFVKNDWYHAFKLLKK